jgi:uncharacterized protein YhjY with autotransporter beta-barrel domain
VKRRLVTRSLLFASPSCSFLVRVRRIGITGVLFFLTAWDQAAAQTFTNVEIDFTEAAFPTADTTYLNGVSGTTVSTGPIGFNVLNDTTGAKLAALNGDVDDLLISFSSTLPNAGSVTPASWFEWVSTSSGGFRANHSFSRSVDSNNPGSVISNTFTLQFADHLSVTDFTFDVTSMNTAGTAWEGTIFEFLDASGNPFSAAPSLGAYLAHTEINPDPGQVTGNPSLGVYVLDSKGTVQNVGSNLVSTGNSGDNENFTITGDLGFSDVGLPLGTRIGGIRFTTFLQDVRGVNNGNTIFTSTIIDFSFSGTINPQILPPGGGGSPTTVLEDLAAIGSALNALPAIAAQRRIALSGIRAFGADVNARLFRLRSGQMRGAPTDSPSYNNGGKNPISFGGKGLAMDDPYSASNDLNGGKKGLLPTRPITTNRPNWTLFTGGDFHSLDEGAHAEKAGFDSNQIAGSVGLETWLRPNLVFGIAGSYFRGETDFGQLGSINSDGFGMSTYLSTVKDNLWGDLFYNYGDTELSLERPVAHGMIARANPNVTTLQVSLNAGYHFYPNEKTVTGPYVSASYINGKIEAYSETGAPGRNLDISGQDFHSLETQLGWQASWAKDLPNCRVTPQLRIAWGRENLADDDMVEASLQDSPFYAVRNGRSERFGSFNAEMEIEGSQYDYLTAGVGVQITFPNDLQLFLNYDQRFFREYEETRHVSVWLSKSF